MTSIYTIGDPPKSKLYNLFNLFLGRKLNEAQEKRLSETIIIDDYVFDFYYHISSVQAYREYLDKVKQWSNKYKWSNAKIVDLLLEPWRAKTGWYDNGGTRITVREWKRILEWEMTS